MAGELRCVRCGRHNPPQSRFCGQCGLNLRSAGVQPISIARPSRPNRAIRVLIAMTLLMLFLVVLAAVWMVGPGWNLHRVIDAPEPSAIPQERDQVIQRETRRESNWGYQGQPPKLRFHYERE